MPNNVDENTVLKLKAEKCERGSKKLAHKKSEDVILFGCSGIIFFAISMEIAGNITGAVMSRETLNIIVAAALLIIGACIIYLKTVYQSALYAAALEYEPDPIEKQR